MMEVGVVGPVGTWDQGLFERFRAAPKGRRTRVGQPLDPGGALRRRLMGELIRINTPLIKELVSQVQGKAPPARLRGRVRPGMRLVGAKDIEWDIALNCGRMACSKALENLDLSLGSFSGYLVKKIFYELQCEVARANMIRVERGARPMGMEYLEDDEQLGRMALEEERDEDAPQVADVEAIEEKRGFALAVEIPVYVAPVRVAPVVDARLALAIFIEDVCRFSPSRRTASTVVVAYAHRVAIAHHETEIPGALFIALRAHGVTATTMRVSWWPTPVRGFAGVCLQSLAQGISSVN
jgi:hypothetical protein